MDGKHKKLILTLATGVLATAAGYLYAQPGNEAYYSTEIDDAVAHAKRNPVNKRYVGSSWYNRSTSKSFPLPKMLNTEMENQIIEGAVGATAAGDERAAVIAEPIREASLGRTSKDSELNESSAEQDENSSTGKVEKSTEVHIREVTYKGPDFEGTARNIRANTTVSARIRE